MGITAIVVFLVLVLAFAVTARALSRIDVTAPMAFVAAGALLTLALPDLGERAREALTLLTRAGPGSTATRSRASWSRAASPIV